MRSNTLIMERHSAICSGIYDITDSIPDITKYLEISQAI